MPIVDPDFLGDEYDLKTSAEGVKISRDIMRQSALARYIRKEHFPGDRVQTQAEFETYARQYGRTSYHPVSTCRMGDDGEAVVDPALRVRQSRACGYATARSCRGSSARTPTHPQS